MARLAPWAALLYVIISGACAGAVGSPGAEELWAKHESCRRLQENDDAVNGCVVKSGAGEFHFVKDKETSEGCIASGVYIDSSFTVSNFGKLRVTTASGFSDADQLFAAGFLEGYLTAARMYDHHSNLKTYFLTMLNATLDGPLDWLEAQEAWVNQQVAANPDDPYWRLLGLVNTQFDGLVAGYQAAAREDQQRREALQGRQGQGQEGQRRRAARASRRLAGRGGQAGAGGAEGEEDVRVGWLERRELMFLNSNGDIYDIIDALEAGYGNAYSGDDVYDYPGSEYELEVVQRDTRTLVAASRAWRAARGAAGEGGEQEGVEVKRGGSRGGRAAGGRGRAASATWSDVDPDPDRMALKLGLQGKCSALIKVTGDLGELLLGHSTHDSFTAMTRVYKHFDYGGLADGAVVARRVAFSSYPGELFSDDDWWVLVAVHVDRDKYLLSSGLVVTETTNHIYVSDVYAPMHVQCVLSWQRIRLANWMASSGDEWITTFARHNSGTYNNQYMVVDTKRFVAHKEMQPGLLWVLEQLPGFMQASDMTDELSRGYWPSYNVAYFPQVYDAAGYPDMIARLKEHGAKNYDFSIRLLKYQIAPRASIFRRDQGGVGNLEDLKRLMRYNDYQNDPYASGNPVGAVCARGDLAKGDTALAKGCYDSKVTSATLAAKLESEVVGGPTTQGQPPFSWSDPRWSALPHRGMPDTFNFTFERMSPRDLPTLPECEAVQAQLQQLEQEGRRGQQEEHHMRAETLVAAGQQGEAAASIGAGTGAAY